MSASSHRDGPKGPLSDRLFRDEAVCRRTRMGRMRTKALAAVLALTIAAFWATLALPWAASPTQIGPAPDAACIGAEQRLAPRFRAEQDRVAHVGLPPRSDFNLLLAWFNAARRQCATGLTGRAAANFQALERMLPRSDEPEEPDTWDAAPAQAASGS